MKPVEIKQCCGKTNVKEKCEVSIISFGGKRLNISKLCIQDK